MGHRRKSFALERAVDRDSEQCPRRACLLIGEQVVPARRERQDLVTDSTVVGDAAADCVAISDDGGIEGIGGVAASHHDEGRPGEFVVDRPLFAEDAERESLLVSVHCDPDDPRQRRMSRIRVAVEEER